MCRRRIPSPASSPRRPSPGRRTTRACPSCLHSKNAVAVTVLGIETSCDETAAAIVSTTGEPAKPWRTRSNVIASQVDIHREWGGVVPEIASRQHVRDICGVVERALSDAGTSWSGIDAIAVTQGPGLVGSLLVGVAFAKAAAATL